MKTLPIFFLFCFVVISSGQNMVLAQVKKPATSVKKKSPVTDLKKAKVYKNLYIILKEGAEIKAKPDSSSETLQEMQFGEKVEVVKDLGLWLAIKRPNFIDSPLVFVSKKATGKETAIPLNNEDLNEIYSDERKEFINEEQPETYSNIEISFISKAEFYKMKQAAINYFTDDSKLVPNKNGEFSLKIGNKLKKFNPDIPENGIYYLGQLKALNKYLVLFTNDEAEEGWIDLIDKTSGKHTASFPALPYFSKDRKMAICLEHNIYNDYAELTVYSVNKDSVIFYAEGLFKNWIPADTNGKFWGSDNCFYASIIPAVSSSWLHEMSEKKLSPDYNFRYIKIRIKGPAVTKP